MTEGSKIKLSISLSPDLVSRIDQAVARGAASSRSGVIESWLRRSAREEAERELEEATIRYYESLTRAEREEDEAWADLAGAELGRLDAS